VIDLKQSRYISISANEISMYRVESGGVEVYACTPKGETSYHKMFLAALAPGECFFSPVEAISPIEFQVFAVKDSAIERFDIDGAAQAELTEAANEWFNKLTALPWVRYLVGMGDEVVSKWDSRTIFDCLGEDDTPDVIADNVEIMSMLITAQFKTIERRVNEKTEQRHRHMEKSMGFAMLNLLRTEYGLADSAPLSGGSADPIRFAVRAAAWHLGMETENISIPSDVAAKLDPVSRMRRLVKKANMQVRLITLSDDWHISDIGVILGYYGENGELVALLPDGSKKYVMKSEKAPDGVPVDSETAAKIRSDAFLCYAGFPAKKLGTLDMFKFMYRQSTRHDRNIVLTMSLVAGLLPILLPLITESIFRDVIPISDRQALGTVTQVMLVSGFATLIIGFVRSVSLLRIKNHVGVAFESALWSRLLSLPVRFFRQYDVGNLVGRMQGVSRIMEILGDNVLSTIFSTVFSFWSLILMFYYSVKLTILSLAVWLVYVLINAYFHKKTVSVQRKMTDASNAASARTLQILNGLSKFRLQGGEPTAFNLWSQTFGEQWKWNLKSRWYGSYVSLVNVMMPTILSMAIFYMTMKMAESGTGAPVMDSAKFMGFQAAFAGFNATLVGFIPVVSTLFSTMPYIENIKPILETEPEVTDDKMDVGELSGEIEIKNLHFSYAPDSPMVLKGISLRIKAGESVALVGSSGCGKSTLVRILLSFEKPTQGSVFFDGQDLSALNAASVRSQMGVVLQNGQILAGDIFTNIVGSSPLTLDDAWEAARMVGLDRDIENMPMGMNTVVSEGAGNISGGQRQRILLARSLVNKPKIVILDEATSALDNTTQAIVTESIGRLKATRIIVAHRLSTIKDADRICVLQDGTLAEEGNYEELMRKGGFFAKLAMRQLA
jgi:ATP-binding cassette subfamily C protein